MDNIKAWVVIILVIGIISFIYDDGNWFYTRITWFQKVQTGEIYENQLTQRRFLITDAHFGRYFIDSLQRRLGYFEKYGVDSVRSLYTKEIYILNNLFAFALNHEGWLPDMDNYLSEFYHNSSTISSQVQERRRRILEAFQLNYFPPNPDEVRKMIKSYGKRIESTGIAIMNDSGNLINMLSSREFNELKSEMSSEIQDWKRFDTYFRCNDYSEFQNNYNKYWWLDVSVIDSKLYKKIN